MNDNLEYLDERITEVSAEIYSNNSSLESKIATLSITIENMFEEFRKESIGEPIITLNNVLGENEIWLEGDTVSRTTYAKLFAIYGTTYGEGDGSTTFKLPDFRNRAIWGASDFGYLESALPNISSGATGFGVGTTTQRVNGACYMDWNTVAERVQGGDQNGRLIKLDASRQSSVYKNEQKIVQPPAIKVRVKTKFK